MLKRVPIGDVESLDEVAQFLAHLQEPAVVVFDADNTLAPQGITAEEFAPLVDNAIDRFEALEVVDRVIVLTNGPPRGVERMESRGNKPWTSRGRLGLSSWNAPIVVVGDQVLTDGVLAWRLGATFLHLVIDDEREDGRQRTMRRIGAALKRTVFKPIA